MTRLSVLCRPLLSPYLIMVLPPLLWAGNAVVGRAVAGEIPPVALSFWRWLLALAVLLPFGLPGLRAQWPLVRRQWRLILVLALTSVAAYNTLLYIALQTTAAINVTLVGASLPIVMIGLSWLWLGETLMPMQWAGVMISLAGVLAVISHGDLQALLALELRRGDLAVLLATLCWSVYSVLLRRHPTGIAAMPLLTCLVAVGLLLITPFYLWELSTGSGFAVTSRSLSALAYVGLLPSAAAYYFWNRGVAALGANVAGQYTYLIPVFTAALAVVFLGETFRWFHAAGLGLIFSGIWLTTRARRQ